MARIISVNEPILPGEVYVTVSTSDGSNYVTVYAGTDSTIYTLKLAVCDHFRARPEQLDIILHHTAPYPLADKVRLDTIHPVHRNLIALFSAPVQRIPPRYLQTSSSQHILNLVQISAEEIPMLGDWLQMNMFHQLDIGSDHPRIDEILMVLGHALVRPEQNKIQTICFRRTFPKNHLPMMSIDTLFAFYQTIYQKEINILLDPFIFGNDTVVDFESWILQRA